MQTPRKCLVNFAHLDPPNNGGVSRLAREIALALLDAEPAGFQPVFAVRARFQSSFKSWLGAGQNLAIIPYSRWFPARAILRFVNPDVIVSPLFGVEPFISTGKIPHVMNMPDTLALDHPQLFSASEAKSRQQTYQRIGLAQEIVTLSEYTYLKLKQHFPALSNRIQVIPLGANGLPDSSDTVPVSQPYIFYPANSWPHKRHRLLLETMEMIWRVNPHLKLVLSGGRPSHIDLKTLIAQYAPPDKVLDLGYVTEHQLSALYAHADALLFTSEYEGFGMPVLEAMHFECPVICAPLTALPETAGEAALFVAGDSPEDWADAYLTRLPQARPELIRRGREQAAKFTWAKSRSQWLDLLWKSASSWSSGD